MVLLRIPINLVEQCIRGKNKGRIGENTVKDIENNSDSEVLGNISTLVINMEMEEKGRFHELS